MYRFARYACADARTCGSRRRWCGNEAGEARHAEWAVVPRELCFYSEVQTGAGPMAEDGSLSYMYNTNREIGTMPNILYSKGLVFAPAEIAAVRSVRIRSAQAKCGEELSCLGVVGHCIEHHVLVAVCFQRRIGCHVRDLCIGEDNALNGVVCQCGFNRIIRQTSGNIGIGVQLTVLMGCRKIVLVKLKRRFTSGVDCCIGDGCRRCSNAGARHDSRHSCCSEFCDGDQRSYLIPFGARLSVKEGDVVENGTRLTEGSVNPHDVLAISGPEAVQDGYDCGITLERFSDIKLGDILEAYEMEEYRD